MRKIIDTQLTDDPNVFGELIRGIAFVGEGVGGYSVHKPRYPFRLLYEDDPRYTEMRRLLEPEDSCTVIGTATCTIGWYNDGDTFMVIKEGDRIAENTDAKKTNNWNWYQEGNL